MLVTTAYDPSPSCLDKARRLAAELGADWVERGRRSLSKLSRDCGDDEILVVAGGGLTYVRGEGAPLFFHPGTAQIRVKRLLNGEPDPLIRCADIAAGDTVLDCTAGLGADSIVFSFTVGAGGQVTAVESERVIYLLLREGLKEYVSELEELNTAMRRIRLIHADHKDILRELPDNSADVVYFDPMFRTPVRESSAMLPLRNAANPNPLSMETVREAVRVARKTVVLKEHRGSGEFARLGFSPVDKGHGKIAYGVIRL